MKFRAGELEFNASVADASEAPSPQTGDLLRSLTIQFRAQKITMHEQALVEAGAICGTPANTSWLSWLTSTGSRRLSRGTAERMASGVQAAVTAAASAAVSAA